MYVRKQIAEKQQLIEKIKKDYKRYGWKNICNQDKRK